MYVRIKIYYNFIKPCVFYSELEYYILKLITRDILTVIFLL